MKISIGYSEALQCTSVMLDCLDYEPIPYSFMNLDPIKSCKNWKEFDARCTLCLKELNSIK